MEDMTESNTQSNLLKSLVLSAPAPEEYLLNKAKIAEAKEFLIAYEEMNEAGRESHNELTRELEQKIREGQEASRLLEKMRAQSTVQLAPPMSTQRPAIDYYPSSASRIEEVPNYDSGSGYSQKVHQGAASSQQIHNYVPQATAQPVGSWTRANVNNGHNGGQSQQTSHQLYSQYSQQNIMQKNSSTAVSYAPFGFQSAVRSKQQPTGQDHGRLNNHSRPMAPTQEQSRVLSHQEPFHYGSTGSNQQYIATSAPQVQMYSPQLIPTQASASSSRVVHTTRPPQQYAQHQSSSTQIVYPRAAVTQTQATASGTTCPQGPPPHKTRNIANQSQSQVAVVAASRPVALGLQPNVSSSNSVPIATSTSQTPISTTPQSNSKGDGTPSSNQTTARVLPPPQLIPPTTMPSTRLDPAKYIREFKEIVKDWEAKVPPNSYFDHANTFKVIKDANGVTRIASHNNGQTHLWTGDVDSFCDYWILYSKSKVSGNSQSESSSKEIQSAMSTGMHAQGAASSSTQKAIPFTVPKAIPSTVHKANIQTTSSFQSATLRPEYSQPGASTSKQRPPTMSNSRGTALQATSSASQTMPSTFPIQLSTPSTSATQPLLTSWTISTPLSMMQTPSSVSIPQTPSRQLSTIVNGVTRSVKQADKRFLASHILFGLGKRLREPDASPTALTEPQAKRHAQRAIGQIGVGVSSSASFGQGSQVVQKPNIPLQIKPGGSLAASSSLQQPPVIILPTISQETQTLRPSASALSGDQQLVGVAPEITSTIEVTAVASTEIPEVSKTFSDQPPLSLPDATIVQATHPGEVAVIQSDSQQETIADDLPVTSFVPQTQSVPLFTSSTIAQTSTCPSLDPLTVPLAVSSLLSPGVNENTTQSVASSKLPQSSSPTKLQHSFISVPSPVSQKQPLFLPSPMSSTDANNDISIFGAQSENVATQSFKLRKSSSSANRRKNRAYVLAPPRPEYLVKYLKLKKQKMSRASLKRIGMTPRSSVSTSAAGEEDVYNPPESHSHSYAYEQQAEHLACSRLQELSCKWDGCPVKMNSVDALIRHLNRQHKPSSTSHSNSFLCRWTQCGRRCNLREKHLEKHASCPLNCPYEDCDESFRSAPPLWKHIRVKHEKGQLKPSAQPSYPTLKLPDAIPGVIPRYMITTRRVNPDAISSARHAVVGPRVLRNIAGLEQERSKNRSRKAVRDLNGDIPDEDASNEYDFLIAHPTRYSSNLSQPVDTKFEDLNSEDISRMVDEGLTLWGGELPSPAPIVDSREHRSDLDEVEQMLIV